MITTKIIEASGGKREAHTIITIDDPTLTYEQQLAGILMQYEEVKSSLGERMRPVFRRWFLSDAVNQQPLLPDDGECATSIVEQPPLSLTKVALWVWMIEDAVVAQAEDGRFAVEAFGHTHIFEGGCRRPGMDPYHAMLFMLTSTQEALSERGGSLLDSCVRTWLFVQNVDVDYAEVVKGRNQAFQALGLTPSTRFIASTGIGGRQADRTALVAMDSYSVLGLKEGSMRQINAPDHLNPTYEYGVAFERATSVDYDDRRHLFGFRDARIAFEPGLFVEVYPVPAVRLRGEIRQGVYGHHGTVGTVAADYLLPVDRWLFSVGPRFNIGDASFARTYFGVSPVEAAINGHVMPYNPGSFYSAGLLAAVTYHQSEAWSYTTFGGYSRILGASGESPLVDRPYGNPNQFTLGLRIDYTFRTKPLL